MKNGRLKVAATALAALELQAEHYGESGVVYPESIVDLVTDLLHLARLNDIEPDYITTTAQMNFWAEVQEEIDANRQVAEEELARIRERECTRY